MRSFLQVDSSFCFGRSRIIIMVESVVSFAVERLGDLVIEEASLLHGGE